MKNAKRYLSVLLAVCLLLTGVPMAALADELEPGPLLLYRLTRDESTGEWSYPANASRDDMIGAGSLNLSGDDANLFAAYLPNGTPTPDGPLHPDLMTVTGDVQLLSAEGFTLATGCDNARVFQLGYTDNGGNGSFTIHFSRPADGVSASITGTIASPSGPIGGELPAAGFYRENQRTQENFIDPSEGFTFSVYDDPNAIFFLLDESIPSETVEIVTGQRFVRMDAIEGGYKITVTRPNVAQFPLTVSWKTAEDEPREQQIIGRHRHVPAMDYITKYFNSTADESNLTKLEAMQILVGMREGLFPPFPPNLDQEINCDDIELSFTNKAQLEADLSADDIAVLKKAVKIGLLNDAGAEFNPDEAVPRYEIARLLAELCNITGPGTELPSLEEYNDYPEGVEFALPEEGTPSQDYTPYIKFLCWKTDYKNTSGNASFFPRMETSRAVAVEWADAIYQCGFQSVFLTGDHDDSEFSDYAIMFSQGPDRYELKDGQWTKGGEAIDALPEGVSYDLAAKTMTLTGARIGQLEVNGRNMPDFDENALDTFTLTLSGESTMFSEDDFGFTVSQMNTVITSASGGSLVVRTSATSPESENTVGVWINGSDRATTTVSGNARVVVESIYSNEDIRQYTHSHGFAGAGSLVLTDNAVVDVSGAGRNGISGFSGGVTAMIEAQLITNYIQTDSLTIQGMAAVTVSPDFPAIPQPAVSVRKLTVTGSGTLDVDAGSGAGESLLALANGPEEERLDGGYYQEGGTVTINGAGGSYPAAVTIANRFEITRGILDATGRQTGIVIDRKATARVANGTVRVQAIATDGDAAALRLNGQTDVTGGGITAIASGGISGNQGVAVTAGNGNKGELTISGGTHSFQGMGGANGDNFGLFAQELGSIHISGGTVTLEGGSCAAFANRPGADNCSFIVGNGMHIVDHSNNVNDPGTELAFLTNSSVDGNGIQQNTYFLRKNNDADTNMAVTKAVISAEKGSDPWATWADVSLRTQGGSATVGSLISMVADVNTTVGTKCQLDVTLPAGVTLEPGSITLNGEKQASDSLADITVIGPGTLRFSVRAAEAKTYTVTAAAKAGLAQEALVTATCDLKVFPSFSINYPPFVADKTEEISVTGTAAPESTVILKAPTGGGTDTSIPVTSTGTYSAKVNLANYSGGWDGGTLNLEAWAGGAKQEDVVITYLSGQPKLASFDVMNYVRNGKKRYKDRVHYAHGAQDSGTEAKDARASASYIYWPGENELEFEVKFHEIPKIYQKDLRVRMTLSNGDTADSSLSSTSMGKKWADGYTIRDEILPVGFTVVSLSGGTVIWSSEYIRMTPIIDPSGYIYEGTKDNRVEGATATLYYIPDQEEKPTGGIGSGTLWADAETYLQINPLTTGTDGSFAWNVPVGWWRVQAEKDGLTGTSEWMHVLPAQTDVKIALESNDPAQLTSIVRSENGENLILTFSKPVDVKSVYSETLPIEHNGQSIPGSYYPENGDDKSATAFYFVPESPLPEERVLGKVVADSIATYNGKLVGAAEVEETATTAQYDPETGLLQAEIMLNDMPEVAAATVFATCYDVDGKMLQTEMQELSGGQSASIRWELPPNSEVKRFTVIAIDTSDGSYRPVCPAKEITFIPQG